MQNPNEYQIGTKVIITGGTYHQFQIGERCTIRDIAAEVNGELMIPLQAEQSMRVMGVRPSDFQVMVTPQSMSGTMSSIVGSNRPLTMQ
jgi:hypothetical protein